MLRSKLFGIAVLVLLLLLPGQALAKTAGISPGDSMVYSYEIYTTYASPNGNVTHISMNQFTVNILSVNASAPQGEVGYTQSITEFNNTAVTVTNSSYYSENYTTIFNPYDNLTYMGNIGFWPFTYTDLAVGSVKDLNLSYTIVNIPVSSGSSTFTVVQHINGTVTKSPSSIDVNMTLVAYAGSHPSSITLSFSSATGVLEYCRITTNLISEIEKIFTYHLLSFTSPKGLGYIPYLAIAAVVAVVVIVAVVRRQSPREKKAARMRERLRA